MSGVYISGLKMPEKDGVLTLRIWGNGLVESIESYHSWLLSGVKAIPVPDHGRLIDATAKVQTQLYDDEHEEWTDVEMTVDDYLGYCHNEVPTIIPGEERS